MQHPLTCASPSESAAPVKTSGEWIIVATKADADVVDHIVGRGATDGMNYRVLWADHGPVKLYSSAEDLWKDVFGSGVS